MPTSPTDRAFAHGFHTGLRDIVLGHCDPPRPRLRRQVGSPATDRLARHRDMKAFRADVQRTQQEVVGR